mgnify:CR=1 FL=1
MLQPKRTKYRKQFKGRNSGLAHRGSTVAFNEYGSYTAVSRDGTLTFVGGSAQRVSGTQEDMLVIAYEAATGTQKWVRRIAAPGEFSARVYGIVASPTADLLFVTGPSGSATTNNDWLTLALSTTTGATVWSRTFGGPDLLDDVAYAINVGPSGGQVYVTGDQQFGSGGSGIRTIAYKAATGATVWSRLLGNAGSSGFSTSVAVAPGGGRVFVGGQYVPDTATDPRAMVTAYAAGDGTPLWTRRVAAAPELPPGTNPYDLFEAVGVSPDGATVYGAGAARTSSSTSASLAAAFNATTGAPVWVQRFNPPTAGQSQFGSLSVGPGGARVVVVGLQETAANGNDWVVRSLNTSDGTAAWTRTKDGTAHGSDSAKSVVTRPDGGRVYVTGGVRDTGTGSNLTTVAYSAPDGAPVWSNSYNGAANLDDYAGDIAVAPGGGRVFVTGTQRTSLIFSPRIVITRAFGA